jgi:AcrR family transcriptional regulator
MAKGTATRDGIVDEALRQALRDGLAGLSFGVLADRLHLSKSGIFAHFRAKEALQSAVLAQAAARFRQVVVQPALARPEGRERLLALFGRYLDWMGDGCVFSTVAQEIDKLPASVGETFRAGQLRWQQTIGDVAVPAVAPGQTADIVLQFTGLALAYQQAVKIFHDTGTRPDVVAAFERRVEAAR